MKAKNQPPKNKIGRLFEKVFNKKYQTDEIKNSGAGIWYKMDAENSRLLFSLKATKNESYRLTKGDLSELNLEARGPGGLGGNIIPAMAICFVEGDEPKSSDEIIVALPMDDLVALLTEQAKVFKPTKSDEKYERAKVPSLFRKIEEEN